MSGFIPQKGKASGRTQNKLNQLPDYGGKGQYREYGANWNWVSPDTTYYYEAGGKFHVVSVRDKNLNIYTLNSDMKFAKKKIVKLGDFDVFGGFYHGRDDCFYVAVGYHNPKESSTKTVVKVKKYNSKWKLQKTCNITGGASNSFVGIYEPFEAGACRMDMQGKTLYLFMGRKMFVHSDGLRHQSNISFEINTASMKAKEANDSYCSHSFNQYVRFQDGNLYLIDHGDAYPRSILLTMVTQYGSNHEKKTRTEVFKLQGATGANFTGATVGGMEAGNKNILVCGTAQPHGYAVKGIKGYDNGLKYNAFVAVVNKTTGKSSIKWLTNYHPKKSKVIVGETRMVKLSDDRFAVLFTTTTDHKATLNYVVVNNAGKKVYSKKYSNMVFAGDSQPILYHGYLQWVSTQSTYATGNYYGYTYTYRTGQITKSYRIPATF